MLAKAGPASIAGRLRTIVPFPESTFRRSENICVRYSHLRPEPQIAPLAADGTLLQNIT